MYNTIMTIATVKIFWRLKIMKKFALLVLSGSMCLASAFCSLANSTPTPEEVIRWEQEQEKYCHPVAECEGRVSRAATLVGSDLTHFYSGFGAYTYIWGYTDVKDGDNDVYHYTRVEGKENGKIIASAKEYGEGYVEAETDDIENGLKRTIETRVYWGEK